MKAKDIEDCDDCPLREEYCAGGYIASPSGDPIEPPCTSWDPETDLSEYIEDLDNYQYEQELEMDRKFEADKKKKEKQELKNKRAREARWHVREETNKIKKLYKAIKANNSLHSLATAFSITNSMFKIEEDSNHKKVKSSLEIKNELLREEIRELETIKKDKLKALRLKRKNK